MHVVQYVMTAAPALEVHHDDLTVDVEVQCSQIAAKTVDSSIYYRKDIRSMDFPFFQRRLDLIVVFWPPNNVSVNYLHVENDQLKCPVKIRIVQLAIRLNVPFPRQCWSLLGQAGLLIFRSFELVKC